MPEDDYIEKGFMNFWECKESLEQFGTKYTDEEVRRIRRLLYKLACLEYRLFTRDILPKLLEKNRSNQNT